MEYYCSRLFSFSHCKRFALQSQREELWVVPRGKAAGHEFPSSSHRLFLFLPVMLVRVIKRQYHICWCISCKGSLYPSDEANFPEIPPSQALPRSKAWGPLHMPVCTISIFQMATFTSAPPMYNPPNVYNANVYSTPSAYSTFQPQAAYYQP